MKVKLFLSRHHKTNGEFLCHDELRILLWRSLPACRQCAPHHCRNTTCRMFTVMLRVGCHYIYAMLTFTIQRYKSKTKWTSLNDMKMNTTNYNAHLSAFNKQLTAFQWSKNSMLKKISSTNVCENSVKELLNEVQKYFPTIHHSDHTIACSDGSSAGCLLFSGDQHHFPLKSVNLDIFLNVAVSITQKTPTVLTNKMIWYFCRLRTSMNNIFWYAHDMYTCLSIRHIKETC